MLLNPESIIYLLQDDTSVFKEHIQITFDLYSQGELFLKHF